MFYCALCSLQNLLLVCFNFKDFKHKNEIKQYKINELNYVFTYHVALVFMCTLALALSFIKRLTLSFVGRIYHWRATDKP
jgi:hypothetical protein